MRPSLLAGLVGLGCLSVASAAIAQSAHLSLASGFKPNPTVLNGQGGGSRPAAEVVGVERTSTGPCLGYIRDRADEQVTLENDFDDLSIWVESRHDTTLIIKGPGGVWCNDDSRDHNPEISGEWLTGDYQIWVGAYQSGNTPEYWLYIRDDS